jgi:Raf kinase inhibitor-like YbhB/YbcL family protein
MELAGGLLLGMVFMFSLLAFSPGEESVLSRFFAREWASIRRIQTASVVNIPLATPEKKSALTLTSPAFAHGGLIPTRFTCNGMEISPALSITGVPEEAQSLVLMMEDYWTVFNIPPTMRTIDEGKDPPGRGGRNLLGKTGYTAPCPLSGEHRSVFRLYALNKTLALKAGSTKKEILTAMEGSVLSVAELVGRYQHSPQ